MGKVIPFRIDTDVRKKLLDAISDPELKAEVSKMTDEQLQKVYKATEGSLTAMVDELQKADEDFAEFIKAYVDKQGNMFIMLAAINYVVDYCHHVPNEEDRDEIDNAHQKVFVKEVERLIERAIREE